MGGKTDQVTGKVKEAAGVLTGDKELEREGKVQHAAGHIKEKAGEITSQIQKLVKQRDPFMAIRETSVDHRREPSRSARPDPQRPTSPTRSGADP